jgi:hypothetical protein
VRAHICIFCLNGIMCNEKIDAKNDVNHKGDAVALRPRKEH